MELVSMLLLLLVASSTSADVHYVRTTTTPLSSCPDQPCHTLEYYSLNNNFTSATTFVFLPGNHSMQHSLLLTNISNITLTGEERNSAFVLSVNATIRCEAVTGLTITRLTFILHEKWFIPVLDVTHSDVLVSETTFQNQRVPVLWSSFILFQNSEATLSKCVFQGNGKERAINAIKSNLTVCESSFLNNGADSAGGAITAVQTKVTTRGSLFINNVGIAGGAISASSSTVLLDGSIPNTFINNMASNTGGAIDCVFQSVLETRGHNFFQNNSCQNSDNFCLGGAIHMEYSNITMSGVVLLALNKATEGGAISMSMTNAVLNGNITVSSNSARNGGGLHLNRQSVFFSGTLSYAKFIGNRAKLEGGAVYMSKSNMTWSGTTTITQNTATSGGGLAAYDSVILMQEDTTLTGNNVTNGGALFLFSGSVNFTGLTSVTHNTASGDGGGVYAAVTSMHIKSVVNFISNTARNGGAMYLENGASLTIPRGVYPYSLLNSSYNTALQYGGGIYYKDSVTTTQCNYEPKHSVSSIYEKLPQCFLQISITGYPEDWVIISKDDRAMEDGSFLYGGLMDRCQTKNGYVNPVASETYKNHTTNILSTAKQDEITSRPYTLSVCDPQCTVTPNSDQNNTLTAHVYRGQKFTVPLLATAQVGNTSTTITAITSPKAKLETYQSTQALPDYCHPLPYTVYSSESHEQVVLYPDGPCRDTGRATVVIDVTLLPCPDGFTLSGEVCICVNRLQDYPINCTIHDTPYLTKMTDSNFWMGVVHTNTSTYGGLILGKSCPAEYCKTGPVRVTLDDPNMQCAFNRRGLLCGACAANHSLMLGSSRCQVCPNIYLTLLLPFAAAGIVLVAFLTFLKLTVATGTLNSVILYANIVQVNRKLFFAANTRNILTVFLAWMNLDLGFQTCFYDGLDAYAQTWLQFAFPLYVWLLIGLIILISRYSTNVSKLIGSNPIAVLATLLLMSYTKVLKIIIEVYSSVDLDYPDNRTVAVWLKDANVPFLQSKHLMLTVVTSLVLVFLFLPYTLLLLLGHKLYRFTGRKHYRWLNRLKPLLDSYYGPFKINTRYWIGFMLIIRCVLYLVVSLVSTNLSLLVVSLAFISIGFLAGFVHSGKLYKQLAANFLEAVTYLNIIVLSASTIASLTSAKLVYSLVGLVFFMLMVLSAYQFHVLYIAKTKPWLRMKEKWTHFSRKSQTTPTKSDAPLITNPSHDPHRIITRSVINLREPLLDT